MDAENSIATAYIGGSELYEWTPTFSEGGVGAAIVNGFTDHAAFKDFQLGRIGMPPKLCT